MNGVIDQIASAEQLRAVGQYLISLAEGSAPQPGVEQSIMPLPEKQEYLIRSDDDLLLSRVASELYEIRRRRDRFLSPALFAEPAWDLLLDLFISRVSGRRVSVTSACLAAAVPETTGLRWIGILIDQGLVERSDDSRDKRRNWLRLSDAGFQVMRSYLKWVAHGSESRRRRSRSNRA